MSRIVSYNMNIIGLYNSTILFCTSTANFMTSTVFTKIVIYLLIHLCSLLMLFWCTIPWGSSKKNETCRSISGLHVKVHVVIFVYLLVLSIKLFINVRIWILFINVGISVWRIVWVTTNCPFMGEMILEKHVKRTWDYLVGRNKVIQR